MSGDEKSVNKKKLWLNWLIATCGWLVCAAICLWLTILLEEFPKAYDILFPAVLVMLFGNIFVFLFIASRWGNRTPMLINAVSRVCAGELLLLGGLYCLGRFAIGL